MIMKNRLSERLLVGLTIATLPTFAFGYIDSGTGSLLIQGAISGVLGFVFVARNFWANWRRPRATKPVEQSDN